MIYARSIFLFLSLLQALMSFLFYKFGGLYFFLEERSEVYPVNQLVSQGGGEDFFIFVGCFFFFILSVFNIIRFKSKISILDIVVTLFVLSLQALSLMMIEVGSFRLSIEVDNGWILLVWFVVYASLWLFLLISVISKIWQERKV